MTTYIVELAVECEADSMEEAEKIVALDLNFDDSRIKFTEVTDVTEKDDHQPNRGGYREWTSKSPAQVWLDRAKIRLEEARWNEIKEAKEEILNKIFLEISGSIKFPVQIRIGLCFPFEEAISELNSEGWDIRKIPNTYSCTVNLKE